MFYFKCYLELICRLCHTIQTIDGHCCILAEGILNRSIIDLFSSIVGYQLISFKTSHFITPKSQYDSFIKHKLTQTFIEAGIRVKFL